MGRVLSSNSISIPVDSIVFVLVAFGGTIPTSTAWAIVWANIVVKGLTSVVSTPLIYAVREDSFPESDAPSWWRRGGPPPTLLV